METAKTPQVYTSSGYELPESSTAINRDRPIGNEAENPFTSGLSTPQAETTDPYDDFPDGGTRSWLVVLGSFFLLMASYGLMNSVGVLQSYLETHQLEGYSSRDVGWISGIFVWTSLGLGVFVGPLFDAYGPKELVTAGTGIYSLSVLLMAECTLYWHFVLCFGFLAGIGAALISNVGMSCVPHWFQAKAGMAIGTAMAGSGLGGVIFPYILRGTFGSVGYKWGMRITALVVLVMCSIASFLVKSRLPRNGRLKAAFDIRCFKDARFTWMALATFCTFGAFPKSECTF
jgi:MFS family permease